MDEYFAHFMEKMGAPVDRRHVPASSIERLSGRLPNQLLEYWKEHGWCGYADGLFWTVDPQEYEPVVEAWIGDTPFMTKDTYHIIARSAFGELYLWGERTGESLRFFAPGSYCFPIESVFDEDELELGVRAFFSVRDHEENDFAAMFVPALEKLGHLKHDEMYGFAPALALGGPSTLKNLTKVKAMEHLVILAQLAPLEVMTPSTI